MPSVWILTGGIGTGKSTVARMFAELGAVIVDADQIGHEMLASDAFAPVAAAWPQVVVDGQINRTALASIVFADRRQLDRLEAISHPLITAEIERRCRSYPADQVVIVDLPIPKASPLVGWDRTIITVLDDETRRTRLLERGMPSGEIDRRMASQLSRFGWLAYGKWKIDTSGTREAVRARVAGFWDEVISPGL